MALVRRGHVKHVVAYLSDGAKLAPLLHALGEHDDESERAALLAEATPMLMQPFRHSAVGHEDSHEVHKVVLAFEEALEARMKALKQLAYKQPDLRAQADALGLVRRYVLRSVAEEFGEGSRTSYRAERETLQALPKLRRQTGRLRPICESTDAFFAKLARMGVVSATGEAHRPPPNPPPPPPHPHRPPPPRLGAKSKSRPPSLIASKSTPAARIGATHSSTRDGMPIARRWHANGALSSQCIPCTARHSESKPLHCARAASRLHLGCLSAVSRVLQALMGAGSRRPLRPLQGPLLGRRSTMAPPPGHLHSLAAGARSHTHSARRSQCTLSAPCTRSTAHRCTPRVLQAAGCGGGGGSCSSSLSAHPQHHFSYQPSAASSACPLAASPSPLSSSSLGARRMTASMTAGGSLGSLHLGPHAPPHQTRGASLGGAMQHSASAHALPPPRHHHPLDQPSRHPQTSPLHLVRSPSPFSRRTRTR